MKYEDLKCEFCNGKGEREVNIDGADCMCHCDFCNDTGIDQDQLMKLIANSFERFAYDGEDGMISDKNGRWIKIETN